SDGLSGITATNLTWDFIEILRNETRAAMQQVWCADDKGAYLGDGAARLRITRRQKEARGRPLPFRISQVKSPERKSLTEAAGWHGSAGVEIRQQMAFVGKRQGPGMKGVELYARVRYAVQIEGVSQREAARRFGIDPRTVAKMLGFSIPPGYRR